jgi:putative acetyltransferase
MIRVRDERPSDERRVFAIQAAAFGRENEAQLVDALRAAAGPRISLVAERDGRVIGHVFVSQVAVDPDARVPAGGLGPVGVDPAEQSRGVGSALVRAALVRAAELGWRAVFLLGNPRYYSRFGFVLASPLGLRYRSADFDRAFQVVELAPGALGGARGFVHFHAAFAEAEGEGP